MNTTNTLKNTIEHSDDCYIGINVKNSSIFIISSKTQLSATEDEEEETNDLTEDIFNELKALLEYEEMEAPYEATDDQKEEETTNHNIPDNLKELLYHPYLHLLEFFQPTEDQLKRTSLLERIQVQETEAIFVCTVEVLSNLINGLQHSKEIAVNIHLEHIEGIIEEVVTIVEISNGLNDYLIDAVALRCEISMLNKLFTDPETVKVMFKCGDTLKHLQKSLRLFFVNVFDVAEALRILEEPESTFLNKFREEYKTKELANRSFGSLFRLTESRGHFLRYTSHFLIYFYRAYKNYLIEIDQDIIKEIVLQGNEECKILHQHPKIRQYQSFLKDIKERHDAEIALFHRLFDWREKISKIQKTFPEKILPDCDLAKVIWLQPINFEEIEIIAPNLKECNKEALLEIIVEERRRYEDLERLYSLAKYDEDMNKRTLKLRDDPFSVKQKLEATSAKVNAFMKNLQKENEKLIKENKQLQETLELLQIPEKQEETPKSVQPPKDPVVVAPQVHLWQLQLQLEQYQQHCHNLFIPSEQYYHNYYYNAAQFPNTAHNFHKNWTIQDNYVHMSHQDNKTQNTNEGAADNNKSQEEERISMNSEEEENFSEMEMDQDSEPSVDFSSDEAEEFHPKRIYSSPTRGTTKSFNEQREITSPKESPKRSPVRKRLCRRRLSYGKEEIDAPNNE